ncbi:TPA: hypothetical protein DIV55_03660 [Patescibacteria group bacterium]|uniref:Laminin G domain-containing protein n=1 Tax=Candidatus Gottesmanbacteria bacterium GW2011_GWA1_43_11 TaxID=1618436 RepID=A0A0G1CKI5_9BACT|nr:MAG: hypothetical protein UV59_C0003G0009 [Candidatus Gottesmanbacteria bacterium GW2011_GWA1_43_11]HCS78817.1 hypothetical protein [Patescibacteria group bacterium]
MAKKTPFFISLIRHIRLRTWIATGIIVILAPLAFAMVYGVFGALGGSNVNPVAVWHFDEGVANTCTNGTDDACDSSGNGNDGAFGATTAAPTIQTEDKCVSGKCLYFDGSNDTVTVANTVTGVQSVSFFVKVMSTSTTQEILDLNATDYFTSVSGTVTVNGFGTDTIYVDGMAGSTSLTANRWHHVAITSTTGFSGSAITIGNVSTNFGNEFLDEIKLFDSALTAAQIKAEFAGGAAVLGTQDTDFLTLGLVSYWPMDERTENTCTGSVNDFCDKSGSGEDLSMPSTTDFSASAKFGFGLSLDGINNDDYAADTAYGKISATKRWTVSAWLNTTDTQAYLVDSRTSNQNGIGIYTDGANTLKIFVDHSGTLDKDYSYTYAAIDDGVWNHIVLTRNADNSVTLYINGVAQTPSTTTTDNDISVSSDTWSSITIGARHSIDGTYNLAGEVDDFRIYNRVLTPAEIKSLYSWAPGPANYWNLDDTVSGDAQTLIDRSGTGSNMTTVDGANNSGMDCKVSGKFGKACDFDGVDDYTDAGSITALTSTQAFTINFWMNPETLGTKDGIVTQWVNDASASTGNIIAMRTQNVASDEAFVFVGSGSDDGANYMQTSDLDLVVNTWQHITLVYDGTATIKLKIYKNGTQITATENGTIPGSSNTATSQTFSLAETIDTATQNYFDGKIDDVRIYDYPRTQQQVVEDMSAKGGSAFGGNAGPIVHWNLDEQYGTIANDAVGNENGTVDSNLTWSTQTNCKINGCLLWNAADEEVLIIDANDADINFNGAEEFSGSAWVYITTIPAANNQDAIIAKWDGTTASADAYRLVVENDASGGATGNFQVDVMDASASQVISATGADNTVSVNTWYHVAWTFNGGQAGAADDLKLYVDGVFVDGNAANASFLGLEDVATDFTVGEYDATDTEANNTAFTGYIDEVKLYASKLTTEQVKIDFNAGASTNFGVGTNEKTDVVDGAGSAPVGYWPLDENTGTSTTYDKSGNGRDGTLTSITESSWMPGKYGSALNLDGAADFVDIGTGPSTVNTVTFWVKPTTTTEYFVNLTSTTDYIWSNAGTVTATGLTLPTIYVDGIQTTSITTGTWHHVAVVDSSAENASNLDIGRTQDANYLEGVVDEVKLFDYALTPAQVAYEFNRGEPVGWWKFDECTGANAYDSGSGENNGTITPGASGNTATGDCNSGISTEMWDDGSTGKFNGSLGFDGANDYVTMGDPTDGSLDIDASTNLTMSAWIKTSDTSGTYHTIMEKGGFAATTFRYSIFQHSDGSVYVYISDNSTNQNFASQNFTITDGAWHHVAGVVDRTNTQLKIYIDGKLNRSATLTVTGTFANSLNFNVGSNDAGPTTFPFNGLIDDVRVYNYVLSADQIKKAMNEGKSVRF